MRYEVLRSAWAGSSLYAGRNVCQGFKPWLTSDDFFIDHVNGSTEFTLSPRNPDLWKSAMAFDAVRFGLNSLQTVHSIRTSVQFPKIAAWHLIQAYYASFFAAHSMLRLFGRPFTQLESGHAHHLHSRAQSENVSGAQPINAGSYLGKYDANLNSVTFYGFKDSHRDLWASYTKLLDEISIQVLTAKGLPTDLASLSGELQALVTLLRNGGQLQSGNWLSSVRNEVNYRSPEEVWFPFAKATPNSQGVFKSVRAWKTSSLTCLECSSMSTQYERFFATCMVVVQISKALLVDYAAVAPKGCNAASVLKRFVGLATETYEV